MDVAFNINYLGLEGLGATLCSLVRNCSNSTELTLWFFCSDIKERDKNNIRQLLENEHFGGKIEIVDFDAEKEFGHLRSLHGDWTTYGRLLIANHIKSDVALYLDADLVVELDILRIKDFEFNDELLAAANVNSVQYMLDNTFMINKLEWSPEMLYFNAGVLLLNLKEWRDNDVEGKWKTLSSKYAQDLMSHDQTLLNALCESKFAMLPNSFNNFWYPNKEEAELNQDKSILHFVGSPKPWDLLGSFLHYGYPVWKSYNTLFWKKCYSNVNYGKLSRSWKIRRSLLKHLKGKYF